MLSVSVNEMKPLKKIALQKYHYVLQWSENIQVAEFAMYLSPPRLQTIVLESTIRTMVLINGEIRS